MARDLLARILTQFRWWVHNESVIFVKSHLTLRIEIEFKENLRVRYRKYGGIENMVFRDDKKQNPLSTEET